MAKTPWEMAAVGREFSHQSALFAWAAMARLYGLKSANDPLSYTKAGHAVSIRQADCDLVVELKWLHAIKNAEKGGAIRGAMSQAEGVRPGVADVFLPHPVSVPTYVTNRLEGGRLHFELDEMVYAGLYLELKRPGTGKPSDKQLEFQADMRTAGYACEIVFGWEAARDCLLAYLGKSGAA